jgi:hypothetical protein
LRPETVDQLERFGRTVIPRVREVLAM